MRIGTNSHVVTHVRTTRSQDASTPALFWHGADWPRAIESFRFVARNVAPGMPTERVLEIMGREVGAGLDATCFEALQIALGGGGLNHAKTEEVPAVRLVSALADDYRQAA